jgi:hypothetical protein
MNNNSTHPDEMRHPADPPESSPPAARVTHLAKNPLKMRHKILTNRRNQLKKRILHPHG